MSSSILPMFPVIFASSSVVRVLSISSVKDSCESPVRESSLNISSKSRSSVSSILTSSDNSVELPESSLDGCFTQTP